MLDNAVNNLREAATQQWFWFAAAAILAILVILFVAYSFRKSKSRTYEPIPYPGNHGGRDGWTSTGRIDFVDPGSAGDFILQVEDTRIVESAGGVEHRDIRWRKATLDEAKRVIAAYHLQRQLTPRPHFIVSASSLVRGPSEPEDEQRPAAEPSADAD